MQHMDFIPGNTSQKWVIGIIRNLAVNQGYQRDCRVSQRKKNADSFFMHKALHMYNAIGLVLHKNPVVDQFD